MICRTNPLRNPVCIIADERYCEITASLNMHVMNLGIS